MFKITLFLLLVAAAAGDKPVSVKAPAPAPYTPPPTAAEPAVEVVEDVEPASDEVAAVEEAPAEAPAEEPAVETPAAEEVVVEEVAAEEAVVEVPVEEAVAEEPAAEAAEEPAVETVAEEPVAEEPAAAEPTYPQRTTYHQPSYGHRPSYGHHQPSYGHHQPSYGHHQPSYGHHQPSYGHRQPAYGHHQPAYGHHQPAYGHPKAQAKPHKPAPPACAQNTTKAWCLEDSEYPSYELAHAVSKHYSTFVTLYQDVLADTASSVDRLQTLEEETYLCAGTTSYVRPLRAQDTDGKWRVIVNGVQLHDYTFTQTARLEECAAAGEPCPLVPACYESTCLQKAAVHRMLIYDEYDHYSPFAIETFRLPSACACALGAYEITH